MAEKKIQFHSEDIEFKLSQTKELTAWLLEVSEAENKDISRLHYIFCSDEYLLGINIEYLGHDYYTDIITFPISETPLEADLFISVDRVRENSQTYDQSFEDELHRVMLHGLLHLTGYDDKSEQEVSKMREKEDYYLARRAFA